MSDKQTKIMFVDDDLITGRVMKRNCDNANYTCSVYQNAQECLDAFRKSSADARAAYGAMRPTFLNSAP